MVSCKAEKSYCTNIILLFFQFRNQSVGNPYPYFSLSYFSLYSSKFRCIFGFPPQRPYRPVYGISDNRGVRLFSPAAPPPFLKMMQDADSLNLVRLVVLKTAHFPAMMYIPGNDTLPVAVYAFILQKSTLAALTVLFHLSPVLRSGRRRMRKPYLQPHLRR